MGNSNINLQFSSEINKILQKPVNENVDRDQTALTKIKEKILATLAKYPEYFEFEIEDDLGMKLIVDNLILDMYDYIHSGINKRLSSSILQNINDLKIPDNSKQETINQYDNREMIHVIGGTTQKSIMNYIKNHPKFWDFFTIYFNDI